MFRAPSHAGLPGFATMLQDLPATTRQTAQHLGIAESTLATYTRTGNAPRSVQLALFWETRWGRSAADTEAANWGALHYRDATMARRELARMAGYLDRLEWELARELAAGEGRPANLPVWRFG